MQSQVKRNKKEKICRLLPGGKKPDFALCGEPVHKIFRILLLLSVVSL
ncbi:protein of unknown function [Ruminococcaceae bacterium BL-6]|nr:protein of unknown function [Ruminococcaceae bacterium BL-6]